MTNKDENIVKKLNKVDFHIHSIASTKDGDKVKFNTIDNINILVNKLIENGVSMAAITDHNAFDIDMYNKFKSFEGDKLNKVLPGIEFDVEFEGKRIHIITIFNDTDYSKIKEIPRVLAETPFDNKKKNAYTEKTYKDILKQIDTNVLLIAHQKSGIRANNQNENLSKIGESEFDYIIGIDYFDAVEFRSGKVEGILKDYKLATVVGTTTYGKGVIQEVYPDVLGKDIGGALKVTVSEYFTPNGNKINKVGIEPDEKVELDDSESTDITKDTDTQLQKAIEILKK